MKSTLKLTTIIQLLDLASAVCHACLDHICYTRQKLFEEDQISGQIAIDRMDHLLYLHYKNFRATDYTAFVDLNDDDLKAHNLPISYSFARAVNQNTGDVFFAGTKGIYKYNAVTKHTLAYGLFSKRICHMQFKDILYFTECQKKGLFFIEQNQTHCIMALSDYTIDDFIVDKNDDIYFTSYFLVYKLKRNDNRPRFFSNVLYSLATDSYDNAYFVDTNARILHRMNYSTDTLSEVGMFDGGTLVFRMVFDSLNRIIYNDASDDRVYLLSPNFARCSLTQSLKQLDD